MIVVGCSSGRRGTARHVMYEFAAGFPPRLPAPRAPSERRVVSELRSHLRRARPSALGYRHLPSHSFFKQMPAGVDEAAMVDGCSRLGAFFRVVLSPSLPGITAVAIFSFLLSWTDYTFVLVMIDSDYQKTPPVGFETMIGQYELRDGEPMAGSSLIALPPC